MNTEQKLLTDIRQILSTGLNNSQILVASEGDVLSPEDLKNSFSIYAPFGEVDLDSIKFENAELTSLTLLGGAQIYGRILSLTVAAGSNPLIVYIR